MKTKWKPYQSEVKNMKALRINEIGLAEIREFLTQYHVSGKAQDPGRWATAVDIQLSVGNYPTVEIRSTESILNRNIVCAISNMGVSYADKSVLSIGTSLL